MTTKVNREDRSVNMKAEFFSENQTGTALNNPDNASTIPGELAFKERSSSEILKIYLTNLGYCKKGKQRHCLSPELNKIIKS